MTATLEDDGPDNVEECNGAEREVTPFVRGGNQSADQTADDHGLICQNGDQDRRPRHTSGQEQIREQKWRSDEPVDIADPEDLASTSGTYMAVTGTNELDLNRHLAEIASHGEVCNRSSEQDAGADVVKDAMSGRLSERSTDDTKKGDRHDSTDGEVPVRAMSVDFDVCVFEDISVHVKCLVAAHGEGLQRLLVFT